MKFQILLLFTILALQLSSADDEGGADGLMDNEARILADRLNEEFDEESPVTEHIVDDAKSDGTLEPNNEYDEIAKLSTKEKQREAISASRVHSFHTYPHGYDYRHTLDPLYLYPWFRGMTYYNPEYYYQRYGLYPYF